MKVVTRMLVFAIVVGVTASSWAEDGFAKEAEKDSGIRVTFGMAPGLSEAELSGMTMDLEEDTGGQIEVLYQRRHWTKNNPNFAGIWGAGLFFGSASGTDKDPTFGDTEVDLSAFGVMGQGGIAYKIGEMVVLEAQPYLGLGIANAEITDFTDGSAGYVMYGIKGGVFAQLGKSFELGVEVGYQGVTSTVELDFSPVGGGTQDLTLTGGGLHASLVAAIKF